MEVTPQPVSSLQGLKDHWFRKDSLKKEVTTEKVIVETICHLGTSNSDDQHQQQRQDQCQQLKQINAQRR